MPLGMEVGLSPDDFMLDGDPAPSPKRVEVENFEIGPEVPVIASFVALKQQIMLVKTRSESV